MTKLVGLTGGIGSGKTTGLGRLQAGPGRDQRHAIGAVRITARPGLIGGSRGASHRLMTVI